MHSPQMVTGIEWAPRFATGLSLGLKVLVARPPMRHRACARPGFCDTIVRDPVASGPLAQGICGSLATRGLTETRTGVGTSTSGIAASADEGGTAIIGDCPSNVIGKMANGGLNLRGSGCNDINNLSP